MMTEEATTFTDLTPAEKPSEDEEASGETESSSGESSSEDTPPSRRKTVTFQTIEIKEHDMVSLLVWMFVCFARQVNISVLE